ncbi:hypothetical protein HanIR_Chr14g0693161 [Helianthus annuus]|nr:hypothetical protein HanIR_Chr14g0693161 [Helianthus annuus]
MLVCYLHAPSTCVSDFPTYLCPAIHVLYEFRNVRNEERSFHLDQRRLPGFRLFT